MNTKLECLGHPAGPNNPMGETVFCDGSCRPNALDISSEMTALFADREDLERKTDEAMQRWSEARNRRERAEQEVQWATAWLFRHHLARDPAEGTVALEAKLARLRAAEDEIATASRDVTRSWAEYREIRNLYAATASTILAFRAKHGSRA